MKIFKKTMTAEQETQSIKDMVIASHRAESGATEIATDSSKKKTRTKKSTLEEQARYQLEKERDIERIRAERKESEEGYF